MGVVSGWLAGDAKAEFGNAGHRMAVDDIGPPIAKRLAKPRHERVAALSVKFRHNVLRHRPPRIYRLEPDDLDSLDGFCVWFVF